MKAALLVVLLRASLVLLLGPSPGAAAAEPVDPDELAALLADLEASGGILTADDLAALRVAVPPTPHRGASARGFWGLALTARSTVAPRVDLHGERHGPRWSGRLRARRDQDGDLLVGWLRGSLPGLTAHVGGGTLVHGAGLLAGPPGRRASLAPDASLMPPRPGWRPSTATEAGAALRGGAVTWSGRRGTLAVGLARDQAGRDARHARVGAAVGDLQLAAAVLQRGDGRGAGAELAWRRGDWRLTAEAARWRLGAQDGPGQAWHLTARWRAGGWLAEAQAAASRAAAGLDGAARPACLPGWRGRGWALRLLARPAARVTAALVYGRGGRRESASATGDLDERSLLGLRLRIVNRRGPAWDLRLRRSDEARRRWDPLQPWLPAALHARRLRTWLSATVTVPATVGEGRLSWRWLEEAGESRNLLTGVWSQRRPWGRWRAGVVLAWGDPLDLVAVSAPVSGLVRLRHWGHWRSGLLAGVEGGDRWRWQCGGELRRRSREAGGDLQLEIRAAWGRSF